MARDSRMNVLLAVLSAVTLTMWPAAAQAQHRGGGEHRGGGPVVIVPGHFGGGFYNPFFYDPFWGPYAWGPYGSSYYSDNSEVHLSVTPKDAEVFVDGYYAGPVSKFSGFFGRLNVQPGGHQIVLYHDGYQTVHQTVYVQPGSTLNLQDTMVRLAPGQQTEPRPTPAAGAYARRMGRPPERTPGVAAQPSPLVRPGAPRNSE
jgi:hypothetical protein